MALTKNVLYTVTTPKPWLKESTSTQLVVDPGSGMVLRELPLPMVPVSAAGSGLYIALRDGRIARFATP